MLLFCSDGPAFIRRISHFMKIQDGINYFIKVQDGIKCFMKVRNERKSFTQKSFFGYQYLKPSRSTAFYHIYKPQTPWYWYTKFKTNQLVSVKTFLNY